MAKRTSWATVLAFCFAANANAQFNGSIEGTVTDASQAKDDKRRAISGRALDPTAPTREV